MSSCFNGRTSQFVVSSTQVIMPYWDQSVPTVEQVVLLLGISVAYKIHSHLPLLMTENALVVKDHVPSQYLCTLSIHSVHVMCKVLLGGIK